MRRVLLLAALCMLGMLMFASVALAVNKVCSNKPCYGTTDRDTLFERAGDGVDGRIYGMRPADSIDATTFGSTSDVSDNDVLYSNRGNDTLNTHDGFGFNRDAVHDGSGYDTCYVDTIDRHDGCEVLYIDGELQ